MTSVGRGIRVNTAAVHRATQVYHRQPRTTIYITPRLPIPPYHRQLLESAARFKEQGDYAIAVVVAQTAAELATELAVTTFLNARGAKDIAEPIDDLLPTYNLDNRKVRKLYVVLSGDGKITTMPFWTAFTTQARLRHKIVHKGATATDADAGASIKAVTDLIVHIEEALSS